MQNVTPQHLFLSLRSAMHNFFNNGKPTKSKNSRRSLKLRLRQHRNANRGFSMLIVLLVGIALVGLLTAYIGLSRVEGITAGSSVDSSSGFYAAETGLNLRFDSIYDRFSDRGVPTGTSPASVDDCTDADTTNDGTGDLRCVTYDVPSSGLNSAIAGDGPKKVAATYVVDNTEYGPGGQPVPKSIPSGEAFAGLSMLEYSYQINSIARKLTTVPQTEAILAMDMRSRVVPIFQFAAFFDGDLETTRTAPMILNGRVHSNGSIYFGAGSSPPHLTVEGQVTTPNDIYASSKFDSTYPDHSSDDLQTQIGRVNIANSAGTPVELVANAAPAGTPTRDRMDWNKLRTNWGGSIVQTAPLQMPDPGLLGTSGEYFSRADLRITYSPNRSGGVPPFDVTKVDSTSPATPRAGTDLDIDFRKSLQQPVLTSVNLRSGKGVSEGICPLSPPPRSPSFTATTDAALTGLSTAQQEAVAQALYTTILRRSAPLDFSKLYTALDNPVDTTLRDEYIGTAVGADSPLRRADPSLDTVTVRTALAAASPMQLAALAGRSFCSAPIQDITFQNYRENRNISILQVNIEALTVWNRDGQTVDWNAAGTIPSSDGRPLSATVPNPPLFATAPADAGAPDNSFQQLGYAASDTSEAGVVVYMTVACANTSEGCSSGTTGSSTSNTSRYGFALVRGAQLMGLAETGATTDPTGTTFATDQAIYTQGDFNTTRTVNSFNSNITRVSNKQPAAILADSFNLLSNACMSGNDRIAKTSNRVNCDDGTNRFTFDGTDNTTATASDPDSTDYTVTPTEVNAGILSGVDVTRANQANGGLHNYPRFHERWHTSTSPPIFRVLSYSGSWVNLNTCDPNDASCPSTTAATPNPKRVRGAFDRPDPTSYFPPRREWSYDTSFNAVRSLPPLDPRFVYLKQDTFVRSFN
jgi:hypothetical protein